MGTDHETSDPDHAPLLDISGPRPTTTDEAPVPALVTRALDFLSTASNETLVACLVGLLAATYLILGRIGLLLIGVVVGVVLHAGWEHRHAGELARDGSSAEIIRRRELGLDILERVLKWREDEGRDGDDEGKHGDPLDASLSAKSVTDFSNLPPETASAMTGLVDAIIRDYVVWWYAPIIRTDTSFPDAARQTLTSFFGSISAHVARKRPADTFLDFLTNASSIFIVFLSELSTALTTATTSNDSAVEAIDLYLDTNPDSNLAHVLDEPHQKRKLKEVAEDMLQSFLDPRAYTCETVRVFLREMLSGVVLDMTIQSCSKAEFINGWIVYLLEDGEPELMNAIDVGMGADPIDGRPAATASPTATAAHTRHRKQLSKAEEAMDEAMQEAQRLNRLIAEEDARKREREQDQGRESSMESLTTSAAPTSFTNFDQILPHPEPVALRLSTPDMSSLSPPAPSATMTLHLANISIFDDSGPTDKATVRTKPTTEYLLQIEPASSSYPGWMIARRYADFESLHEVLRRISVVSGATDFTQEHAALPGWKGRTKSAVREDLERYLRDALANRQLAESEGMKRFLEKEQGVSKNSPSPQKTGFGWSTPATTLETVGKGMLDVIASAPKGAADGGKAILGGVGGVLGANAKKSSQVGSHSPYKSATGSDTSLPRDLGISSVRDHREEPDVSSYGIGHMTASQVSDSTKPSINGTPQTDLSSVMTTPRSTMSIDETDMVLPPPPSDIKDDYGSVLTPTAVVHPPAPVEATNASVSASTTFTTSTSTPSKKAASTRSPLSEGETRIAIELLFATITSLYTLSSAWNIRLTLLSAAKTFLLRPGNPNLESIRVLLQSSMLDANTSDAGIATHLLKIRANSMPTVAELASWPAPATEVEKARLRDKARKLLVEKGMPRALTSVMGAAASGEALGRVFDALQDERVARALVFGVLLQGVRALTQ